MAEEKFILLSLEEKKSKELAQVISSDTSRKILDLLAKKEYAETDIAKELNMPLSTVHYNTQLLLKNNLIEIKDFLWSEKGKKIQLYRLANKLIIIAPKGENNFIDKIKTIIPVALSGFIISGGIYWFNKPKEVIIQKTEMVLAAPALDSANVIQAQPAYALYFLFGMIITISLYLMVDYIRSRK